MSGFCHWNVVDSTIHTDVIVTYLRRGGHLRRLELEGIQDGHCVGDYW
ncbi:hypothetical protein HanHA300_Chr03g0091301 [Helianthus annuus]|nr:hypothetical protein HanHA300_Chr03g0091301 [Helianthus annuus]KAJ0607930.1 hypothetical protein HanHA89_Chr03g0102951 [Helianthus annuus]KAJ0767993.1 hypothetical protein HanLR1_Chr03g0096321 [Helianthus annuus]